MKERILGKFIFFLGTDNVGKSTIILQTANFLSALGKEVLVIDITNKQSMFSYFKFDEEVESTSPLRDMNSIIRNNFEILINDPKQKIEINFEKIIESLDLDKFDYILIESDGMVDKNLLRKVKQVFIIQNSNSYSLNKNIELIKNLKLSGKNMRLIFNQYIEINYMDSGYMANMLVENVTEKLALISTEDVIIPYNPEDVFQNFENQVKGKLMFNGFSETFKYGIQSVVNILMPNILSNKKKLKIM